MALTIGEPDFSQIPRKAIAAFERTHRVNVAVHDLAGVMALHLDPPHTYHRHPFCQAVKTGEFARRCVDWEVTALRPKLILLPQGRSQVCHMGLLEWVVPVPGNDGPVLVLFAGPCLPKPSLEADAVDRPSRRLHVLPALRRVDAAESRAILESLHQLGARLRWWLAELKLRTGHVDHAGPDGARRERVIRQFVHEHHTEPVTQRDLALALRLSPSRCAHVVRLVTGKTLRQLLYDARVETACWLLAQTDLPLKQIVRRVRIHDPSYFHRLFRQRTGLTPARYRRQHRT